MKYNPLQIPKTSHQGSERAASHVFHSTIPWELALNKESIKLERAKSHPVGKKAAKRGRTKTSIGYTCCCHKDKAELAVGIKCPKMGSAVTIAGQGQYWVKRKTRIRPQRDQSQSNPQSSTRTPGYISTRDYYSATHSGKLVMDAAIMETVGRFLNKLKLEPPHHPATALLGISPKEKEY